MQLADLTWPAVQALNKNIPVIFPVAALEQHGHHLPLFTDSLLLGEIMRRVSVPLSEAALFAPLTWLGNSDHHLDFAGTLSAPPRVYLDTLAGLCENFIQHGFKRLVFINGHGGNDVPGKQALFEVRQKYRQRNDLLFLFGTYWNLANPITVPGLTLKQTQMGHACEWETSMILRIAPQLVGAYRDAQPVEFGNAFEPGFRAWITCDRSAPGHIGYPNVATAEKGEALLQIFSSGVQTFLERVIRWDGQSWNG
jgi:creatinine amidohydrolase